MAAVQLDSPSENYPTPETATRCERVFLWICAALALFAAILLFQNYFVGQWLPKATGGWQLVSLG